MLSWVSARRDHDAERPVTNANAAPEGSDRPLLCRGPVVAWITAFRRGERKNSWFVVYRMPIHVMDSASAAT